MVVVNETPNCDSCKSDPNECKHCRDVTCKENIIYKDTVLKHISFDIVIPKEDENDFPDGSFLGYWLIDYDNCPGIEDTILNVINEKIESIEGQKMPCGLYDRVCETCYHNQHKSCEFHDYEDNPEQERGD